MSEAETYGVTSARAWRVAVTPLFLLRGGKSSSSDKGGGAWSRRRLRMELDLARVSGRNARPGLGSNAEEFVMDAVEATELWWVKTAYDFRGV